MSLVPSNMVDVSVNRNTTFTLEQYLYGSNSVPVPISVFGNKVSRSLVEQAVNHMKSSGGGEISVPVPEGYEYNVLPNFIISVIRSDSGGFTTRYQMYSKREPIGLEERPYGGKWEVGDVVYNYAVSDSYKVCLGWICSRSGIPGTWVQIGQVSGTGSAGGSAGSGGFDGVIGPIAGSGILSIDIVDGKFGVTVV